MESLNKNKIKVFISTEYSEKDRKVGTLKYIFTAQENKINHLIKNKNDKNMFDLIRFRNKNVLLNIN